MIMKLENNENINNISFYCVKLKKNIKLHNIIEKYVGNSNFIYQNGSYMIIKNDKNIINFDRLLELLNCYHLSEYINVYEISVNDLRKLLMVKGEDENVIKKFLE